MKIRIATRLSPLAMLQTKEVIKKIQHHHPTCACEVIKVESDGDVYHRGSRIGKARNVKPEWTAGFFFFFFMDL